MARHRSVSICAALLTLLVASVAAPPAGAAAAPSDVGREVSVRVMSYNMHWGMGADGVRDLHRVADVISSSGADVVGLQEVDVHWSSRSDFVDQARWLADELDMRLVFAPILNNNPLEDGQPRRQFGTAILSSYPITASTDHQILRLPGWTTTGFPEAVVNVDGAMFHFYTTHLDWRGDPTLREGQVADMLDIVAEDGGQTVLVGDLNAPPQAPELAPLWAEFDDAWDSAGDGAGLTFPTADPVKRIDYVLTSPDIEVEQVWVHQTPASDHLPVVADLTLTRGDWQPRP